MRMREPKCGTVQRTRRQAHEHLTLQLHRDCHGAASWPVLPVGGERGGKLVDQGGRNDLTMSCKYLESILCRLEMGTSPQT